MWRVCCSESPTKYSFTGIFLLRKEISRFQRYPGSFPSTSVPCTYNAVQCQWNPNWRHMLQAEEPCGVWAQGLMSFCSLSLTGVYFDSCVRQIKFVDFCGKYRLPLMHYLCSPECSSPYSSASQSSTSQSESDSEDEASVAAHRMQKVLLG